MVDVVYVVFHAVFQRIKESYLWQDIRCRSGRGGDNKG